MILARVHRYLPGLLTYTLAAATLGFVGFEVLRPGHHVHLGSEGGHHHHFFVGAHTHDGGDFDDHDHGEGSEGHAFAEAHAPADGTPPEPAPDHDSNPGLIDGFTLQMAKAPLDLGSPTFQVASASVTADEARPESPVALPGGARAPPLLSLV